MFCGSAIAYNISNSMINQACTRAIEDSRNFAQRVKSIVKDRVNLKANS